MIKIKICGLCRAEDVRSAVALGVDFLGFNFYPGSPRYLAAEAAAELCRVAGTTLKVGVFVNGELADIVQTVELCRLDLVQLHGEETPEFCRRVKAAAGCRLVKAFAVAVAADLERMPLYRGTVDYFLLDARSQFAYGGTGTSFPWALAVRAKDFGVPVFVAGGLTPENVGEACRVANPFAVDVAGGVEESAGRKSRRRLELFVKAVNSAVKNRAIKTGGSDG